MGEPRVGAGQAGLSGGRPAFSRIVSDLEDGEDGSFDKAGMVKITSFGIDLNKRDIPSIGQVLELWIVVFVVVLAVQGLAGAPAIGALFPCPIAIPVGVIAVPPIAEIDVIRMTWECNTVGDRARLELKRLINLEYEGKQ
jgi:hypothetical protein